MRIAFLTPEYPTEPAPGGLAHYLRRMARALRTAGHVPEIFVPTAGRAAVLDDQGIRVEQVPRSGPLPAGLATVIREVARRVGAEDVVATALLASGLARAFAARDRVASFDIVQSSDYLSPGRYLTPRAGRLDLIRCSSAADLFQQVDGVADRWSERVLGGWERAALRAADGVYAPSEFTARHYTTKHGIPVGVVRPPAELDVAPVAQVTVGLPPRFLSFVGRLGRRKGTDTIAAALPIAWQSAPDLEMVWSGPGAPELFARYQQRWGARAGQVRWIGVRPAAESYAIVARAEASVLPSVVDNLPNTVIESLLLGVPVIGTRGSSIDELVEEGRSGLLVPIEDPGALAAAMVRVWRREVPWERATFRASGPVLAMTAERAAEEFLRFAAETAARKGPR